MTCLDYVLVVMYFVVSAAIGIYYTRRASGSMDDYFLSGRNLGWFLAGTSMIATAFDATTPVTAAAIIRMFGMQYIWLGLSGIMGMMMTTVFFARILRRSYMVTDVQLLELRYSGKGAALLRFYGAVMNSVVGTCFVMAMSLLAMTKLTEQIVDWPRIYVMAALVGVTVIYTALSGLWGVVATDAFQFVVAMIGAIVLMVVSLVEIGGPAAMIEKVNAVETIRDISGASPVNLFPQWDGPLAPLVLMVLNFTIMWWIGGLVGARGASAQRILATKDDRHSFLAVLWYTFASNVLRTWPWAIVGICSIALYPGLKDPETAYPRMIVDLLPSGLRGLMVVSMFAAFMSTINSLLNVGSSYFVKDLYQRFLVRNASESHYVLVSRICTVAIAIGAALFAVTRSSIVDNLMLFAGLAAGTGILSILRWYWWRTNAWSELAALVASTIAGVVLHFWGPFTELHLFPVRLAINAAVTACVWVPVTYLTQPVSKELLVEFYRRVRPPGGVWGPIAEEVMGKGNVPPLLNWADVWAWFTGSIGIMALVLGIGELIMTQWLLGIVFTALGVAGCWALLMNMRKRSWWRNGNEYAAHNAESLDGHSRTFGEALNEKVSQA